jgi:hypothetical protein
MRAINAFIMRPWFERLRVQQEICLASSRDAVLVCGSTHIPWEAFERFILAILRKPHSQDLFRYPRLDVDAFDNRITAIEAMCSPLTQSPFNFNMQSTEQSVCSDDRDRIHALLGIHEQTDSRLELTPSYQLPVEQVYQAATLELLKRDESLTVLSSCELRPDNEYEMPSWVPDFSIPRLSRLFKTGDAAGESVPAWECFSGDVLRLRGTRVGRLQDVRGISISREMDRCWHLEQDSKTEAVNTLGDYLSRWWYCVGCIL